MSRVSPCALAAAAVLLCVSYALAQPAPPGADTSGDETSPALLKLIQQRLAGVSGLRPADGVQLQETKFFRGTVRVRGTVTTAEQRDAVRREIEALRPQLEMMADVRIATIDVSGLQIAPRGSTPPTTTPSTLPAPQAPAAPQPAPETIVEEMSLPSYGPISSGPPVITYTPASLPDNVPMDYPWFLAMPHPRHRHFWNR
jgi:hypothetical protein